jgi:glycosyltransferase involved in cell wall biosynthesis
MARLLIVTQVLDRHDPWLGFFHGWVEAFAHRFERVTVVCLRVGDHDLPNNVRVYSLGKTTQGETLSWWEHTKLRVRYACRFLTYVWKVRSDYDAVFVHMNQEYVLIAGWLWRLLGKRVTMWRNHYAGTMLTNVAVMFCHTVFCTSRYSYTARFAKTVFMPVGVPTDVFVPEAGGHRTHASILSLGRISPAKKIDQLVTALGILHTRTVAFSATIVGDALPQDAAYADDLRNNVTRLGIADHVSFRPGIPYAQAPTLFAAHDVFVNQSKSGMFDKTIFEAMAAGTLVAVCNKDLHGQIDDRCLFREDDVEDLARTLTGLLTLSVDERQVLSTGLRSYAIAQHSLAHLSERLVHELTN